jgi:arylsulfatase
LFAGYKRYALFADLQRTLSRIPRGARRALGRALGAVPVDAANRLLGFADPWLRRYGSGGAAGDKIRKLAELVALWDQEAERHGVFPLDDRMGALFGARFRKRSPHPENRRYVYRPPMSPLPGQASAAVGGRHVDITARVTLAAGDEGVLFATGTQNSGISMFVQGGRLVLDYNAFSHHTIVESDRQLPTGDVELTVRLRRGEGMLGSAEIAIDGQPAGSADLGLFMRMISSIGPSVGSDHGSPVSQRYSAPYEFTGTLHEVVIQASPEKYGDVAAAAARAEMSRQ